METKKEIKMTSTIKAISKIQNLSLLLIVLIFLGSCQEVFVPDYADDPPTVVIEGYIQAGEDAIPPYVTIGKTYPLFQTGDQIQGPELFIGGAFVTVIHNGQNYPLTEICTANLDQEIAEQALNLIGLDSVFLEQDLCFYIDINQSIGPLEGENYDLRIVFEGKEITASTTIPSFVPIDSLKVFDQLGIPNYRSMNAFFTDPVGPNFYRLRVSVDGSPFAADFSSVTDDVFFDGKAFDFPVPKPVDFTMDIDPNTAGLFEVSDTARLEWQLLDEDHFDFWNTIEFARANQGPFASYSRAKSNIEGGIGIWGGSAIKYYEVIIE